MCETGKIFYENSFILGTKLNVCNDLFLRVEKVVQFPRVHSFFFVANVLRAS